GESLMGLRTGERLTVADLLRGLLIVSANDAAVTLANDIAGSQKAFVRMMNRRARELGLHDTHYANPVGLDAPGNYSSAADLVKLALVLRQRAFFRATTNLATATLRSGSHVRHLVNRNDLVRTVPLVNGVKTGHTTPRRGHAHQRGARRSERRGARQRFAAAAALRAVALPPQRAGTQGSGLRRRGAEVPRRSRRPRRRAHRDARRAPRRARDDPRRRRTVGDRGSDGGGNAGRHDPRAPARPRRRPRRAGHAARDRRADARPAGRRLPRPIVHPCRPCHPRAL
ncbi:MAG: D-alanyl-D-alanine carboxypeptidase, partial [Actinobacteria bacterium]